MQKSRLGLIFLYFVWSMGVYASDLPRGGAPGPGKKFKIVSNNDPLPDCSSYLSKAQDGSIAFEPSGTKAYFLALDKMDRQKEQKSFLIQLDIEKLRIKRIVSLKANSDTKLVLHKTPPEAVSLINFARGRTHCGQGIAKGVGIKWVGGQRVFQSFDRQYYKLIATDGGVKALDLENRAIRDVDLNTLQKRQIKTLPSMGVPLYFNLSNGTSIHYDDEGAGSITRYRVDKQTVAARLKLAEGMQLIQQGSKFGVIRKAEGKLVASRLKGWSGETNKNFWYAPSAIPAEAASLALDFDSGLAFIVPKNQRLARELRVVEVIDGSTGKALQVIRAPKDHYFSVSALGPDARYFVIIASHLKDNSLGAISVYDLGLKKLSMVHMGE